MSDETRKNGVGELFALVGRTALVTGAGRGIGRAVALALARAGASVAVQDIEVEVAQAVVREIESAGGRGAAIGGDAAEAGFPEAVHSAACSALGAVTVLVNNAGVQEPTPWTEVRAERMHWHYQANVVAPLRLMALCHPGMKAAGGGRVINVSSIQGYKGHAGMITYGMTKAAIDHLTRSMSRELAPDRITINSIAPGYFDTYRNRKDFPDESAKRERGKWVPMGRVGEPEDVVGAVLLLASGAGAYITGQTIYVDGGLQWR